ncbi:MAG: tetratricopeptide repeat protein [Tepidisphaeraceae bacterium]
MTLQQEIDRALSEHSAGRFVEAEAIYRKILSSHPNHPPALHLLGVALSQQGNKRAAAEYINRAIALNPNVPDFHSNLALTYCESGEPEKAIASCRRALALQPSHTGALNQMGTAFKQLGRLEESIDCYQRAIAAKPDFAVALGNLADSYRRVGRNTDADALYEKVLSLQPDDPAALCARAHGLLRKNEIDSAITLFRKVVEKFPNDWIGHNGLGVALVRQGKLDEAAGLYEKAIPLAPDNPGPWNNLGYVRVAQGRIGEGIAAYDKALAIRPDYADALNNLGNGHLENLDLEKALQSYEAALFVEPDHADAHWNRALLHLLKGDFPRGWLEYEWRWLKFPQFRRHFRQPKWDGFDIAGKTILVHAEQGFGDVIQFVRLTPLVSARGATVNLECQREISGLLQHVPGIARTITRGDPIPPFDVHCPLMSLPRALRLSADSIPSPVPYLEVDENLRSRWEKRLRGYRDSFNVGIVWAGSRIHPRDTHRSMDLKEFDPLGDIGGVKLFSLQKGDESRAGRAGALRCELVDFTDELHDFSDTAALMLNLDLVIGVDTAVVHLAGALARGVWTLLPFSPDWRWHLDRGDSPWYPTMRLFRQSQPGEWSDLMKQVAEQLRKHIDQSRRSAAGGRST